MMLLLCSSNGQQAAFASAVYFMVVLSTCSAKECGLQLTEKMKSRSVVFRNVDMKLCQTECIGDSFIFTYCGESRRIEKIETTSRSNHHSVRTEPCGSKVCSDNSHCVDEGCEKACLEAPPLCDLHTASKTGDLSRVKLLLSQGRAEINGQEWIGRTPVMWAASGGHREVFELLVSKGASVSLVDRFGINILHAACLGGDVEVVKYVLSQNMVDINGRVRCGRTAVMLAAENGHKDVVELLVDKEADVSLVDETGDNILHCACRGGHAEVVKYILSQEMVDMNSLGHGKKTPVMVAVESDHKEVVEVLLQYEANLLLADKNQGNALHRACHAGQFDVVKYLLSLDSVDINSRGWKKRTPVIIAAEEGHKEVVELLVKHGADLSLGDKNGDSALHRACYPGQLEVVKYLLSLSSVDINSGGLKKRTPAMSASVWGQTKVVELLVKHGADLSLSGIEGNVLHVACQREHFDLVKYVLSLNRLDIDSRGWKRGTPVMVASRFNRKDVVELLVQHGADLSLIDGAGENILHHTCVKGFIHVVKYILSLHPVDINSRGWKNRTPAIIAARFGHKDVIELLVKHGANLSLRNNDGKNCLDVARKRKHFEVVQYVRSL